jgi:uncharacterized membrane protein YgcG
VLPVCNDVPTAFTVVAAAADENCRLKIATAAAIINLMNFILLKLVIEVTSKTVQNKLVIEFLQFNKLNAHRYNLFYCYYGCGGGGGGGGGSGRGGCRGGGGRFISSRAL